MSRIYFLWTYSSPLVENLFCTVECKEYSLPFETEEGGFSCLWIRQFILQFSFLWKGYSCFKSSHQTRLSIRKNIGKFSCYNLAPETLPQENKCIDEFNFCATKCIHNYHPKSRRTIPNIDKFAHLCVIVPYA